MAKDLRCPINSPPSYSRADARTFGCRVRPKKFFIHEPTRFEAERAARFTPLATPPSYCGASSDHAILSRQRIASAGAPFFFAGRFSGRRFSGASLVPTVTASLQKWNRRDDPLVREGQPLAHSSRSTFGSFLTEPPFAVAVLVRRVCAVALQRPAL
jgi:hypothetical protein